MQSGIAFLPIGAARRQGQQCGQVLHDPVTDHDRLVAGVDADVNVQSVRDHPPRQFLKQLHQVLVALVLGHPLFFPEPERVRCSPPQLLAFGIRGLLDQTKLSSQIFACFGDTAANTADDFDTTLHQLVFDTVWSCSGKRESNPWHPLTSCCVVASTMPSSSSTPTVWLELEWN